MTHRNKKNNKCSKGAPKESKKGKPEPKISFHQLKLEAESVNLLYKQCLLASRKSYATFAYWLVLFILDYFIWNPLEEDDIENNWHLYLIEIGVYFFLLPVIQLRANYIEPDENIDYILNDPETPYQILDQQSADLALKGVTLALKTEVFGRRNFSAATLTAARAIYGYFFSVINPSLTITVSVNLVNLTLYYKLISDIQRSRENVKQKLRLLEEHLTKVFSRFLKHPISSIPSPHLSCCLLIISLDNYKHKVKSSTLAKLMVELLRQNGIKVHRREGSIIIISGDQHITDLTQAKINEIDDFIFQIFNTRQMITQVSRLAESMHVLAKLTKIDKNKLFSNWQFEIEIPEKYRAIITKQKLLTIYSKGDVILQRGSLLITGNKPNYINLDDLISQIINADNNQNLIAQSSNSEEEEHQKEDTEKDVNGEPKQKTKKASNQEMLASLPHYKTHEIKATSPTNAYQVTFEWQKQKHIGSQVDVVRIRNNIYGIFRFAEPALEKRGLKEEGGISKFRSIFQAAKVAQRRVGAEGIILRETGTSVDKIKVLGAFGGWQVKGDRVNATISYPETSNSEEQSKDEDISLIVFHQVVPRH